MLKTVLRRLLYGGTVKLRPYEAATLEQVRAALPLEGRSTIDRQISSIGLVQRFSGDALVAVHFLEERENLPLFANRSDECRAVRLLIRPQGAMRSLSADVVFHQGRLSSIEYTRPPGALLQGTLTFEKVEILQDLLHAEGESPPLSAPAGPLLQRIHARFPVRNIVAPASETALPTFLKPLGALPADYLSLLGETDGFSVGPWRFTGTKARRVLLHGNLWLAAETDETALCLRESARQPTILFFDQINDQCMPIGASFIDAFMEVLSKEGLGSA